VSSLTDASLFKAPEHSLDQRAFHITHLRPPLTGQIYGEGPYRLAGQGVQPRGGVTLAFMIKPICLAPYEEPGYQVNYGISVCNPSDLYNKKEGAAFATARALQSQVSAYSSPWDGCQFLGTGAFWIPETALEIQGIRYVRGHWEVDGPAHPNHFLVAGSLFNHEMFHRKGDVEFLRSQQGVVESLDIARMIVATALLDK